mmetsp:Transcript_48928/g.106232  ORF Transcript_48928/g.106232 Transcript_48928/m.106232 type:complete len:454 (+) Transcript_48928:3-1364(+)
MTLPSLEAPELPLRAKTPFGMAFEKTSRGFVITSVNPKGVAAVGGVRVGDVLVQIAHQSIGDKSESFVKAYLGDIPEGATLRTLVSRGDKTLQLEIVRSGGSSSQRGTPQPPQRGVESPQRSLESPSGDKLLTYDELQRVFDSSPSIAAVLNEDTKITPPPPRREQATKPSPRTSAAIDQLTKAASDRAGDETLGNLIKVLRSQDESLRANEEQRAEAEAERNRKFDAVITAMRKQTEGLDKLLRQSLLRERELTQTIAASQRGEETRRAAEDERQRNERERVEAEKIRREQEQQRKNGELERHMLVKQHEGALDAFKRNMQKSEGEAWGRLGVLIDSLKSEKASVRAWVDKLNDEHRRVRELVQADVDQVKTMFRGVEGRLSRLDASYRRQEGDTAAVDADSRTRFEAVEAALRDAQGMLNQPGKRLSGRGTVRSAHNSDRGSAEHSRHHGE